MPCLYSSTIVAYTSHSELAGLSAGTYYSDSLSPARSDHGDQFFIVAVLPITLAPVG